MSPFKKILLYIKISRPLNALITFLVIIVASIISITENYFILKIILAGISGAITASAGNVINDYYDINIDKINRPNRILPKGYLTLKEALIFYFFLTVSAIIISAFINLHSII